MEGLGESHKVLLKHLAVLFSSLLFSMTCASAQQSNATAPAFKSSLPKGDLSFSSTSAKKPPVMLHATKKSPIMRSAIFGTQGQTIGSSKPQEHPLSRRSPLTVIREEQTAQGLNISFVGPPDTDKTTATATTFIAPQQEPVAVRNDNSDSSDDTDRPGRKEFIPANWMPLDGELPQNIDQPPVDGYTYTEYGWEPSDEATAPQHGF